MDISNGEGVGVALFVQGCHLHCPNCFNPETWDFNGGKEWTKEVKNKFLELANRPYIKRISILGGEPLAEENLDDILDLVNEFGLSKPQKSIWLYTGYTWEQIIGIRHENQFEDLGNGYGQLTKRAEIVMNCDVLVDGEYIDSERDTTLPFRGSKNQRLIKIKESLQKGEIVLWK